MRSVAEHRERVLRLVAPLSSVTVPVAEGLGLVLATDLTSRVDLPVADNSGMDGYAVRAAECAGAEPGSPVVLPVAGDVMAGDTTRWVLAPGTALRIMTGAPAPAGADAVVPVEDTDGGTEVVTIRVAPEPGRHVRRRGEDVRAGSVLLRAGTPLGPAALALAAAANVPDLVVTARPRVGLVSTGDELVLPGRALGHGQVVDSNGVMLSALVKAAGAELVAAGSPLPDDGDALRGLLALMPGRPDLLVTTGGVSMGVRDPVKEVMADLGVEFVRVAMRPGMPQGSGHVGSPSTPVLTLPGNPVSAFVSFHVFVLPVLRRLAGRDPAADGAVERPAAAAWRSVAGKVEYTRVSVGPDGVRPSGGQGSHMLGALAAADALAEVPATVTDVRPGDVLRCLPLLGQDRVHV